MGHPPFLLAAESEGKVRATEQAGKSQADWLVWPEEEQPRFPHRLLLLSAVASTALWTGCFLAAHLLAPRLEFRDIVFGSNRLPGGVPVFPVALLLASWIMHLLFASRLLTAQGWRFGLYPLKTIPVAAFLCFALVTAISSPMSSSIRGLGDALFACLYLGLGASFVSLTTLLWFTWPVALLNQWLIRKVLRRSCL